MKLLYFAWVRQKVGRSEEEIEVPANIVTVGDLMAYLQARGDGYAEAFGDSRLRAAVDQEHVGFDALLGQAGEVAFFPPVTGG